jgi:hypothetical protein
MHQKYAGDGLAVVSVNIDDPADQTTRGRAAAFLTDVQATFTNLALAPGEKSEDWFDNKLKLDTGLPYAEVYDRHGRRVQRFSGGNKHEQIEKLVAELLKQK